VTTPNGLEPRLDDERDVIWLAGLAEGEATFDLHRGKYPRVRVGMTDRDVVGRAATLMGSRVTMRLHPAPNQATWHAEVSGEKAIAVMTALLPHMGSRRSGAIATVLGHSGRTITKPKPQRPPGLPLPAPATPDVTR
jgi:hypothetical protein